jgi:UDP-N-acetylmuramate--alanine ligase
MNGIPRTAGLDLSVPRRVHIVGVAGAGMSAIALMLARMGHRVSGSDLNDAPVLARLRDAGVEVRVGNRADFVPPDADEVVYSTAVAPDNVELAAARDAGLAVMHRASALRALTTVHRSIGVAGSHGKTTTTSMLALILRAAGWRPSFVLGADVNELGANAHYGGGEWFVVEADESDGTFLHLDAEAAIVTNVEPDHLDHYGGFAPLVAAFEQFVDVVRGAVLCGADDRVAAEIAASRPWVRTFGRGDGADYRATGVERHGDRYRFSLEIDGRDAGELTVPVGVCSVTNATGAAAMALELGAPFSAVYEALGSYQGVERRFQFRGARDGVDFVDDYAHLPGEVAAAIATAREGGWRRVVVVFQPHRYTRTASIGSTFADAFAGADTVVLTDVYAAGEPAIPGVSGRTVYDAVTRAHPDLDVRYVPRHADLLRVPDELAGPGDLVLTLGAGDVTALPDAWMRGS